MAVSRGISHHAAAKRNREGHRDLGEVGPQSAEQPEAVSYVVELRWCFRRQLRRNDLNRLERAEVVSEPSPPDGLLLIVEIKVAAVGARCPNLTKRALSGLVVTFTEEPGISIRVKTGLVASVTRDGAREAAETVLPEDLPKLPQVCGREDRPHLAFPNE
jgi:hypothetical protein